MFNHLPRGGLAVSMLQHTISAARGATYLNCNAFHLCCPRCESLQFGSSSQAVFFKMRVAGVLHIFQFETRQGEDICMALQTHINDIMMKRYSKVRHHTAACTVTSDCGLRACPSV